MKVGKGNSQLPPGPRGLPLVVYLPFLGRNLHRIVMDLAIVYGPIYKLWIGSKLYIIISSPTLVKEVVRDHDRKFANRNPTITASTLTYRASDTVFASYGSKWQILRKLFVHEVLSKANLDAFYAFRRDEMRKIIREIYNKDSKAIDIGDIAYVTMINMVSSMLWGGTTQGEKGTSLAAEFRVEVSQALQLLARPNVSDFFPMLARFDLQGVERDSKNPNSQQDMVIGGTNTTSSVVEWTMSELMLHQDVITKLQEELAEVVGINNTVEEFHIQKLQYLQAIVKEALRLHPPAPLVIPHWTTQDCNVFLNVWAMHRDPQFWDNPSEFRPNRFLSEDTKLNYFGNNFHFLPFGSGKRICAGLPLAERMLMYVLATFVHMFNWKLPDGTNPDALEKFGFVLEKATPLVAIPTARLPNLELYS
ncbi:cytochrome P450 family 706 subfamily A polypeptide 4 [Citrus sinensis]|uniref:Cytochrome P450 family 706 subfamily A polypeptide 4 n=1 Tax=Citrus sinensis TaxID=2711 RepID=A0ACB8LV79_CITSI|nr:cytochrome P450 family 706 subfamily A polypeptide 4 [Citrus sinensis]